ncbi:hypothetical protein HG535_0F05780 [Zygotorulaspora mrakii]|uniref:t-SNARE coiled-coil homology domain-containing protein n=1 Tax=Zygotorulaspora mrakii TaxID=42260 RepID=A0A7H9B6V6_ZYGMR|nr:uncharacterized protein HG535_0F05780 [Zygotorulaspora mrakii]QLG74066.1 hypothetical protein HG535_0F05780 [Zygotorulaspora mrakii]
MTDQTALFRKCVHIVQQSIGNNALETNANQWTNNEEGEYLLKDTFIKESQDLLKVIFELRKVLKLIEPQYFSDTDMSESEKDEFDTELRLQFHRYAQKFRLLQNYEEERQKLITQKFLSGATSMSSFFHSAPKNEKVALFHRTNNEFRLGVLQILSMWLNTVSSQFTSMQQKRLSAQKKFDNLDFNSGLHSPSEMTEAKSVSSISQSHVLESTQEEVKRYEETISMLTQEQLQLLENEHEDLLNQKDEQLKAVGKINKTIVDIVSIQNEISANLQVQSQNINNILDHQDDIEINIKEGNKQLTRAKKAAGRTARMTTYTAIILAIVILFLDYVS